jgi:hypothetical protein
MKKILITFMFIIFVKLINGFMITFPDGNYYHIDGEWIKIMRGIDNCAAVFNRQQIIWVSDKNLTLD